jgi:hypothetical protein
MRNAKNSQKKLSLKKETDTTKNDQRRLNELALELEEILDVARSVDCYNLLRESGVIIIIILISLARSTLCEDITQCNVKSKL